MSRYLSTKWSPLVPSNTIPVPKTDAPLVFFFIYSQTCSKDQCCTTCIQKPPVYTDHMLQVPRCILSMLLNLYIKTMCLYKYKDYILLILGCSLYIQVSLYTVSSWRRSFCLNATAFFWLRE